jgi:hypothetical protein
LEGGAARVNLLRGIFILVKENRARWNGAAEVGRSRLRPYKEKARAKCDR